MVKTNEEVIGVIGVQKRLQKIRPELANAAHRMRGRGTCPKELYFYDRNRSHEVYYCPVEKTQ